MTPLAPRDWRAAGAILRGHPTPHAPDGEALVDNGLHGVVARALQGVVRHDALRAELLAHLRGEALVDALRTRADRDVCRALDAPIVLKGAALGHAVYEAPLDRPRVDLDVLVDDLDIATQALSTRGYRARLDTRPAALTHARTFTRRGRDGFAHHVDVHARVYRAHALTRASEAGLVARSVELPALGARRLSNEDALVHAGVHLFANNSSRARGIWYVDVAKLAVRADLGVVHARAVERGALSLVHTALARAHAWLGSPCLPGPTPVDAARLYLHTRPEDAALAEVLLARDVVEAARYASAILAPSAAYLRARNAVGRDLPRWRLLLGRWL